MISVLLLLGVLILYSPVESKNLLEEINKRSIFSEVARIIQEDQLLALKVEKQAYTAFMPTNEAMMQYQGPKDSRLIQYHLVNLPYLVKEMPDELNTDLPGNPQVYVTRLPSGNPAIKGWEDYNYFINNAKIIDANYIAQGENQLRQVLHIVDQVIVPTVARSAANVTVAAGFINPDAQKLLLKPHFYGLVDYYDVSEFERRISALDLLDVFNISGKNTFFIPVNQALNDAMVMDQELIDKQVIHGHVVPGKVLFTRAVENQNEQYESLAFTDNLKVFVSMEEVSNTANENMTYYVKSNTVAGDVSHDKGTMLARIVKGNIPVTNGVVHLIDRPLMVVASNIVSYLQDGGQLNKFHHLIHEHYNDLLNKLFMEEELTLFAPSNEAFKFVNEERLNQLIANRDELRKLLELHVVKHRLTTDEIVNRSTREILQEETMSNRRKLYFAVNEPNALVPVVSLEGAGVNATITTPNIAAKNGVIHIIDRILGIPSQTVYEKLASDPMLSSTFFLSEQENWNERLKSKEESFTLFVPSNEAWSFIKRTMPSAYKKLFMGDFAYHVRYILERHMIVGKDLSLEELTALTNNSTRRDYKQERLNMTRGKIYFQAFVRKNFGESTGTNDTEVESDTDTASEYYVEWNGIKARVIRPDVECVNGVVHVIDQVLMLNRDVTVSGSAMPAVTGMATLIATFVTVAFARALHH
ncbi:fasciclin-1 isoform X3 [Panulirus ornatus]|uniref:fasciclin-1 isoform X3 n=1 Tax=Panulirus ornatus TaxID=150431 RepID=UPI003A8A7235